MVTFSFSMVGELDQLDSMVFIFFLSMEFPYIRDNKQEREIFHIIFPAKKAQHLHNIAVVVINKITNK
jgi:hypothetical protein